MGPGISRTAAAVLGACLLFVLGVGACQGDSAVPAGGDDGGAPVDVAEGGPDAPYEHIYPAPHALLPLVDLRIPERAKVQAHQKVVTLAFEGDPVKASMEAFTDVVGASDWWAQTTHEYCTGVTADDCVGPTTVIKHVTLSGPPPTYLSPTGVEDFLQKQIASGAVPPPDDDVVYMFLFPASVKLGEPGFESCVAFDGYHGLMKVLGPTSPPDAGGGDESSDPDAEAGAAPSGDAGDAGASGTFTKAAYAVQAQCSGGEAEATVGVAHELIEAATDPDGFGFNATDTAWSTFFYPEVGDLCVYEPTQTIGAGFAVQSGWSNVAARAGKNPCVPNVPGDVYFNAAPAVSRVSLKVGESTTVAVMPFSTAPTPDWRLDALDVSTVFGDPAALQLTLGRTTVHNGLPVTLTVKLLRAPDPLPTGQRAAVLALSSTLGKSQRYWPMLVVPK